MVGRTSGRPATILTQGDPPSGCRRIRVGREKVDPGTIDIMGLSKLSIGLRPSKRKATEFSELLFKAALPASVHAPLDRFAGERQHLGHS